MQIKIFTLPFDEETEGFPDEIISEFCLNKKVLRMETEFFRKEGKPYWSVAVHYELVLADTDKLRDLDDGQKLLVQRLKEWRKETGILTQVKDLRLAASRQRRSRTKGETGRSRTAFSLKRLPGF